MVIPPQVQVNNKNTTGLRSSIIVKSHDFLTLPKKKVRPSRILTFSYSFQFSTTNHSDRLTADQHLRPPPHATSYHHRTMTGLYLTQSISCSSFSFKPPLKPSLITKLKPFHQNSKNQKKIKRGICRAEFSPDAPLAAAIGACMVSSLLLPVADRGVEDDGDSAIDAGDTRFAAMGIISFIPYFNWLSWVFAWLDTGKRRYAVYSVVYLAPYIRSKLSLSPEDSWLPIASILFCIVHVQLEASIRNGDLQGFQIFSQASKHLSSRSRVEDSLFDEHEEPELRKREYKNLPDAEEQTRNEIRKWGIPRKPAENHEQVNGDWDNDDDGSEH